MGFDQLYFSLSRCYNILNGDWIIAFFSGKGNRMKLYKPLEKFKNVRYRVWGLLLIVVWLSLHTVVLAESEGAQATLEPAIAAATPTPIAAASVNADASASPDQTISVTKTDVRYAVDFSYLLSIAPNSIAWLYQPDTTINQPVMYCDNPEYYLRRQFNDRISANGAIFMTGEETPDFSALVITLYGRNCMDYSLFGSLSYYQEDAYYQENPTLYLITPEGDYQLDIFAGIRTKLGDDTTWRVSQDSASALVADVLPGILERSFIKPNSSYLPVEGDAWAILSTESYENQGTRYVIYARKRPIDYATTQVAYVNKLEMDSRTTLNGYVSVENVGEWMSYSQNDPIWDKLVFETQTSSRRRTFGDGGCGPTAVAMAIVNLVDKEALPKIAEYASSPYGFRFCKCSVNDYWCSGKHLTYQLTTPDEYLRYFPLAVASFATGNNVWGVQGRSDRFGSSMRYLENLCSIFDISVTQTYQFDEAITFLQTEKTIAIACTSGYGSPFTKTSHFLVLAGVDDEYLYVLDPLRRESYENLDRKNYLEIIEPGLVRIKLENAAHCNIGPIYLLKKDLGTGTRDGRGSH